MAALAGIDAASPVGAALVAFDAVTDEASAKAAATAAAGILKTADAATLFMVSLARTPNQSQL